MRVVFCRLMRIILMPVFLSLYVLNTLDSVFFTIPYGYRHGMTEGGSSESIMHSGGIIKGVRFARHWSKGKPKRKEADVSLATDKARFAPPLIL